MTKMQRFMTAVVLVTFWGVPSQAQTADEIIEKHLAASGGRGAMGKLTSRTATGSIIIGTPVGDLAGTLEVYAKAPNKSRQFIKLDLSKLGAGEVISDQRFDGAVGYQIDSFNGNREITGGQLEAMKNGAFPTPLLGYKENGVSVSMLEREKAGDRDAYVLLFTPKTGPAMRAFIDVENLMLVRTVMSINVPQVGGDIEQVVEFSDYRDVDGVKVAFAITSTNSLQTIKATLTDVKHNTEIDDASFVRPPGQ
jgi:outer membrane lipoprotein-sorting protein